MPGRHSAMLRLKQMAQKLRAGAQPMHHSKVIKHKRRAQSNLIEKHLTRDLRRERQRSDLMRRHLKNVQKKARAALNARRQRMHRR